MVHELVRRTLDGATAALCLAALAPLLAAIAVAIRLGMGSPVLFTQTRTGKGGRPFVIYKFRTMTNAPPGEADAAWDPRRITALGRLLRDLSLDELPQLWNVVRGDMALVGPRPLLERYSPWLTERERTRFTVRPGITGWAQLNGRANAPWDERLAMDVWYVDHRSLLLDLKILALTALHVVRRKDVHLAPGARLHEDLDVERQQSLHADGHATGAPVRAIAAAEHRATRW